VKRRLSGSLCRTFFTTHPNFIVLPTSWRWCCIYF